MHLKQVSKQWGTSRDLRGQDAEYWQVNSSLVFLMIPDTNVGGNHTAMKEPF